MLSLPLLQLFHCFFDRFTAGGTLGVLEELILSAILVLAKHHEGFAAGVAFVRTGERLTVAQRAGRYQRPSAIGAEGIPALDGVPTERAHIPERASVSAFRTETVVSVYQFSAMDTRLFVCRHNDASGYLFITLFFEKEDKHMYLAI
jgi:hypothetical protein